MGSDPTSCPSIYLSCDDFMCVAAAATMLASGSATSSLLFWSECGQYAAFPSSNTFLETKHEWKFPATALSSTNQLCSIVTSSFAHIHSPLHPSTSSANLCASWRRLRKCSGKPEEEVISPGKSEPEGPHLLMVKTGKHVWRKTPQGSVEDMCIMEQTKIFSFSSYSSFSRPKSLFVASIEWILILNF